MNPILAEIYSTIVPSMPYIIGAFVLTWLVLLVWVFLQFRKQSELARRLEVLEEAAEDAVKASEKAK
jgi:CcmD family protein